MKELINQQSIDSLKKSRRISILCIIITVVATIVLMVPLFIFATSSLRYLFIIALSIFGTIGASIVLYIFVVSIMPLNSYIKVSTASLTGNRFSTKGKVVKIADKVSHYKSVAVYELRVNDLEEENKSYIFFVEQNSLNEIKVDGEYNFITFQSVVVSYEDLSR